MRAQSDRRFDRPKLRWEKLLQFWLGQWRHPRYRFAGAIHILIFSGFILLATQAFSLLFLGMSGYSFVPGTDTGIGLAYGVVKDYASTIVFLCMMVAAARRIFYRPTRYAVPAKFGKGHPVDAIFLLGLIALLTLCEGRSLPAKRRTWRSKAGRRNSSPCCRCRGCSRACWPQPHRQPCTSSIWARISSMF